MAEEVSLLMDGELDPSRVDAVCRELRAAELRERWVAYHVIGDALRGEAVRFTGISSRLAERLADEPTVLAPAPRPRLSPARTAWAVAASAAAVAVVGWVALKSFAPAQSPFSVAGNPFTPVSAVVQPARGGNYGPYLLVHQEYSPTTLLQGVQPYIRAVAEGEQPAR